MKDLEVRKIEFFNMDTISETSCLADLISPFKFGMCHEVNENVDSSHI